MTIVHRNNADSEKRSYAAIAAIPAIVVPAPIAIQNSFSALQDDTSESEEEMKQFDWKSVNHPSDSDDNSDDSIISSTYSSTDSSTESSSDGSEEELIVNQKYYRRVRQPWCKEGIPCFVTSLAAILGFAYFMKFVFYMCGLVHDDCCSPMARLQCSKGL